MSKNNRTIRPYNVVDFKNGFKARLDSYHRPILNEVSDDMWYDLQVSETFAYGDWEYVNGTLKNYKNHCLETPEKAAEYLITLSHKAYVYRNVEPELAEHYSKEHNEIQIKIFENGVEMFGEEGFLKWAEMCD